MLHGAAFVVISFFGGAGAAGHSWKLIRSAPAERIPVISFGPEMLAELMALKYGICLGGVATVKTTRLTPLWSALFFSLFFLCAGGTGLEPDVCFCGWGS